MIQDALRIVAYSMEAHNWELVRWFLTEHQSPDLGAYFLPIIAQVRNEARPVGQVTSTGQLLCTTTTAQFVYTQQDSHCSSRQASTFASLSVEVKLRCCAGAALLVLLVVCCAQEGKLGDMQNMLQILSDLGRTDNLYFKQQVCSLPKAERLCTVYCVPCLAVLC